MFDGRKKDAEIKTLSAQLAAAVQARSSLELTLAEASQRQMDELARVKEEAKQKIAEAEASAEKRAARLANSSLASIGVTEFAVENFSNGRNQADADVLATFNSLSGIEKTEYYQKHKAEIMRCMTTTNVSI